MWTPTQDAELKQLWATMSASQIAAKLGTTRNAVIGRYHRLCGTYAKQLRLAARARRAETAKARDAVKAAERQVVLDMKRRMASGLDRDKAVLLARENGATLRAIGDILGVTRERVRQIEVEQKKESVLIKRESRYA